MGLLKALLLNPRIGAGEELPTPPAVLEYVFVDATFPAPYEIYYNKIDAAAAVQVDASETSGAIGLPPQSIARMSDDTIYVVYRKKLAGQYQIYVTHSVDEGENWSAGLRLSTYAGMGASGQSLPCIAVDSGDNLHVVWNGKATGYTRLQIWYAKYDGSWGAPIHVDPRPAAADFTQGSPSIAVDSGDNLHLVWSDRALDTIYRIAYSKYTGSWSSPINISVEEQGNYQPVIAVDSGDDLHVVWDGFPVSMVHQIYYVKYDGSWGTPIIISTAGMSTYTQAVPRIAVDSSDHLHAGWHGKGTGHTTNDQIWYAKYTDSWATPICISTAATMDDYYQNLASIAIDESDNIHVTWYGRTVGYASDVIWYAKFVASWEAPECIEAVGTLRMSNIRWSRWP